jgi:hypothetical protein
MVGIGAIRFRFGFSLKTFYQVLPWQDNGNVLE